MSFKKQGDPKEIISMEKVEVCAPLIGQIVPVAKIHYFIAIEADIDFEGKPFEVDFNYKDIYNLEDTGYAIVGFWHTHPFEEHAPSYSSTDEQTMKSWCTTLGRDLLCIISNSKDFPEVFVFNRQGFVSKASLWKWGWSCDTEKGLNRLFVGSF